MACKVFEAKQTLTEGDVSVWGERHCSCSKVLSFSEVKEVAYPSRLLLRALKLDSIDGMFAWPFCLVS